MHRQTPLTAGFVGYTSGGARTLIDSVNDGTLMQEMKGTMMFGEARDRVESPQNYGFTSVVMPATKGKDGRISESAEGFMSFIGGNRSFPVCAIMDDRRFRLKGLKPGDVAMFDHLQHQMHFNGDGMFMTGRTDKKMKIGLVAPPQDQSSGSGATPTPHADSGGSGGSSGQSGGQKKQGQKQRYDQDSKQYMEITKDATTHAHDQAINHKSPLHGFQPGSSGAAATRAGGGPLVQIFGDKFTAGLGHFMKQVTAAPPISAGHVATKGYVDSIISALGFTMPTLPSLPMPSLPPGVTLPPGITLPLPGAALAEEPTPVRDSLEVRLAALERRVAELENRAV